MAVHSVDISRGDGSQTNRNCTSKLTRGRLVGILALVMLILLCFLVAYLFKTFNKEEQGEDLMPPNPVKPLPPSASKLRVFRKAAVCADGAACAEVGKSILEQNGSAVDAALATLFCNGILNMQSMGLGGGFFMTVYDQESQTAVTLDARESAPLNSKPEMYKDDPLKSQRGILAVGVPGQLKGYWAAHQRFGKLPWKKLIEPSIELCDKGYNMSTIQHTNLVGSPYIKEDSNLKEWFLDDKGRYKPEGSLIRPQKMCDTLRMVAENGGEDFYTGNLSKIILKDLEELGSIITAEDLRNYTVRWLDPVAVTLRNGDHIYSVPPPASGVLLEFMLNILDGYNFTAESIDGIENTVLTYHRMIEAFKYAYAKRTELGDIAFVDITSLINNLTSSEYAESIRKQINDTKTSQDPRDYGAVFYNKENHGTAHIAVISDTGDAVSVTSSVNIYFGCGLTSKSTGIILNSGMDDFSFPYFKNYFGLPGSPNNAMVPGKRSLSSMSPIVVTNKDGVVRMVIGASGGTKITTAVAQVIMRSMWFGQNIKEAVDAPRIHHQIYPMSVSYEYGTLEQIVDGLRAKAHKMERSSVMSVVCALLRNGSVILSNADYRKGGDAYGF